MKRGLRPRSSQPLHFLCKKKLVNLFHFLTKNGQPISGQDKQKHHYVTFYQNTNRITHIVAHWQGTQNHCTKANLTKESQFCHYYNYKFSNKTKHWISIVQHFVQIKKLQLLNNNLLIHTSFLSLNIQKICTAINITYIQFLIIFRKPFDNPARHI